MSAVSGIISLHILDHSFSRDLLNGNYGVLFVLRGSADVELREETVHLAEEDMLFLSCGELFRVLPAEGALIGAVELDRGTFSAYLSAIRIENLRRPGVVSADMQGSLRQQMRAIFRCYPGREGSDAALLAARTFELASLLLRSYQSKSEHNGRDELLEDQISNYLRLHYREPVSLTALSEKTYYSVSFLSRFIKRRFGKNFTEYLTDLRLEQAENMIVSTRAPFLQIAADCGFPNAGAFNRAFRRAYGLTPTEYRKQSEEKAMLPGPDPDPDGAIAEFMEQKRQEYSSTMPRQIRLTADFERCVPLHRFWEPMINCGSAHDLLKAEMQSQILFLKKEILYTHVRFWDIWADEMMLYDGNPEMRFNFTRLDAVMDFLHSNGLFPYLDLSFRPAVFAKESRRYLSRPQRDIRFRSRREFVLFVRTMLEHYIRRYDAYYVSRWILELWYDSRLSSQQIYAELFSETAQAARAAAPGIRLGGAGTVRPGNTDSSLEELLSVWSKSYVRPDFFSISLYPFDRGFLQPESAASADASDIMPYAGADFVPRFLSRVREIMERSGFGNIPLHLSEWSFTYSSRDSLNDSLFKGACMVRMLTEMIGKVDLAGYMFASDLYSEYFDSAGLLNGGCGLLTRNGIPKPAFFALRFFRRLYEQLLTADDNAVITRSPRGEISIVCHNYCHPNSRYYELLRTGDLSWSISEQRGFFSGAEQEKKLEFVIEGIPDGTYYVKKRTVDSHRGSIQDEWLRMGGTDYAMGDESEYLKRICVADLSLGTIEVRGGRLEYQISLQPHAIEHIYILPQE